MLWFARIKSETERSFLGSRVSSELACASRYAFVLKSETCDEDVRVSRNSGDSSAEEHVASALAQGSDSIGRSRSLQSIGPFLWKQR